MFPTSRTYRVFGCGSFYIALRPHMKAELENGSPQSLVGGIRVLVQTPGSSQPAELTYKFDANVSMSVLQVNHASVLQHHALYGIFSGLT